MKYVLFVCTHNAGRSQMAQALFERYAPEDVRGESAGSDPGRQVWPEVVEVMRELDIDLSRNKPKRLSVEMQLHADWAVTISTTLFCEADYKADWEQPMARIIDDWGLRYPGVKNVEHVYFYGAAIADEPQLQEYLRRARQLGRDFALPVQAPPAAAAA